MMTGLVLAGSLAIGMAAAFVSADYRSPSSRALGAWLFSLGLGILGSLYTRTLAQGNYADVPFWIGFFGLLDALVFLSAFHWLALMVHTIPVPPTRFGVRYVLRLLRLAQGIAVIYGTSAFLFPEKYLYEFLPAFWQRAASHPLGFYWFMGLIVAMVGLAFSICCFLLRYQPDRLEWLRLMGLFWASPLFISSMLLAPEVAQYFLFLGEIIFLISGVHYHVRQGQRAQFMQQFMSPQIASLVRERGLKNAMQMQTLDVTVICCDLRGFTAYARDSHPQAVLHVLQEYYGAIGQLATEFGATIKDQAGDGILMLMGAPIPHADHPIRAAQFAEKILQIGQILTAQWRAQGKPLGLGVGVATGLATVGIIGAASRYEYTAVGSVVNLACRLCENAKDGEALLSADHIESLPNGVLRGQLTWRAPLAAKGFPHGIAHGCLTAPFFQTQKINHATKKHHLAQPQEMPASWFESVA